MSRGWGCTSDTSPRPLSRSEPSSIGVRSSQCSGSSEAARFATSSTTSYVSWLFLYNTLSDKDNDHLQNHEDLPDAQPPPIAQVVSDGILAIVGGADTVSGALTSLFFCLMAYPDKYARLQAEVDQYYPPGSDVVDTKWHRDMKYLDAVM